MKRKQKKAPIVLSTEDLVPSVIGTIDEKGSSNFVVILLFAFLIAFIIFLPDITNYFTGQGGVVVNPPTKKPEEDDPKDPTIETKFYPYSDSLTISIDGMLVQGFQIVEGSLSLTITNQSEAKNYLVNHQLYLELYDENKMLLQRIKMPNDNISKNNSADYQFDLNISESQIAQVVLEEKTVDDYPIANLHKEEDDTYSLTCTKGTERLTYLFSKEQKLYYITDVANYSSSIPNYNQILADSRSLASTYNAIEGVTSNIVETGTGFTITSTLSLEKIDFTNRMIRNSLNNSAFYGKDTEGKVVYFELSAMNYQCS